jgi:predicted regulator of Ras-like GTPase activity (Roadblock/LC7/MglB family)
LRDTLEELKNIMKGIVGSFVIDEQGEVAALDLPETLAKKAVKISKLLYYVINVMKSTRRFERIILDSENQKMVAILVDGRILVVVAEKDINIPLLKLVSKIAVSKVGKEKVLPRMERKISKDDVNKICNDYDELFGVPAKKLIEIFGDEAARMFDSKITEVQEDHPKLFSDVGFGSNGKPKISKIKMNSNKVSGNELAAGLEDMLVSMLETLKDTAGANIADKAIDEIIKIKEEQKNKARVS